MAKRSLQQIEESLRARLAEQDAPPGLPAYTKDGKKIHYSKLNQPLFPAPKSMQKEPSEADKFVASMLPGVGTVMDIKDIADTGQVDPLIALGLLPGGGLWKKGAKGLKKIFGKADDAEDLAAAARKRVEPKFEPGKAEPRKAEAPKTEPKPSAEAPKTEPKPKVTVKPGETMDQAILRTEREKIAKARNDQAGAKVWRPGGEPKVWRRGSDEKVVSPSGGKPSGGKETTSGSKEAIEDYRNAMRELGDPNTPEERKKALRYSLGLHAGLAALLGLALKKDKEVPPPGGSEAGADDRGVVWVDTTNFVPTDTASKDIVKDPKSSAAVTQEPATAPEKPIEEPEIRLDQIKPSKKTDVTKPDEKSAEPERVAPKKEKTVPVPEPASVPPAPSEKTVPSPGGSPGRTDTPSVQPKKEPGTTPSGRGDRTSPADGTGPKPGDKKGPAEGPGTGKEFKYDPSDEVLMREARLRNKYQNFLPENQTNPNVVRQGKTGAELQQTSGGQFMNRADRLNQARVTAALGNDPKTGQPYVAGRAATNLALAAKFRNQPVNTSTQQMAPAPAGGPQNLPDKDKDAKLNAFAPTQTSEPAPQPAPAPAPAPAPEFKYDPSDEVLMRETQLQNKYQNFLSRDNKKKDSKNESKISERKERWTREQIEKLAQETAEKYNVPWPLAKALMRQESGTSARANIVSSAGAIGPMQLMPDTAKGLKVDPYDIRQNIDGGMRYLKQNYEKYRGNLHHTLSAYNAGPVATDAWISGQSYYAPDRKTGKPILYNARKQVNPTGAPWAETVDYQQKIINNLIADTEGWETLTARSKELGGETVARADARAEPSGGSAKPRSEKSVEKKPADTNKQKSETKPGYYTVGDSHGVGIAQPKTPWIKMSTTGSSAFDPEHLKNIEKIPPGSVVAISIGANDLGGRKISDIVDQVNKTIKAAQARGLQVVHLLPTSTTDPKLQKKREELRQALLTGQTQAPIVNLGQASKKDPMELHLSPQGYQQVGDSILQSFKPGAEKPVGTLVKPDWSKYNFGDQGILEKIGPGRWRSESGKIFTNAPELEVLPTVTKPETFLDKIQRTLPPALGGKGELVSQVFGDKKKSAVTPTTSATPVTPTATDKQPAKDSDSGSLIDKLFGIDQAKQVQAQWAADTERREAERKKTEVKSKSVPPPSKDNIPIDRLVTPSTYLQKLDPTKYDEWSPEQQRAYDAEMERLQAAAGDEWSQRQAEIDRAQNVTARKKEKSGDVTALLQKDQSGLAQAKQAYKGSLASQRLQALNPEITDVNRIKVGQKINLPGQSEPYTVKKGDTLDKIASRAETSAMRSVAAADSRPSIISKDFGNARQLALDPGEEIVDTPTVTTTGSDRFNTLKPEPEPPAPSEIQQAMRDFEREQAALDSDEEIVNLDDKITAMKPGLNAPGQNIDWKTIAPELFTTDKDDNVSSTTTFKESINTTSNAELHDILRLAGRLK